MNNLAQGIPNQSYNIKEIDLNKDENLAIRLFHLGFLPGEKVSVLKKTPFTGDSLLVDIRGTQLALTKNEAKLITIESSL